MRTSFRALALTTLLLPMSVLAQQYPTRALTWLSAFPVGATSDLLARESAKLLSERLGQPVIVEPVSGGGGVPAAQRVVNSRPDGYTFLFITNGIISSQAMRKKPDFDLTKDLVPIATLFEGSLGAFVNPGVPAKDLKEFIAHVKANPGKVNYASSGIGSVGHLLTEVFMSRAGITMTHIPYRGAVEFVAATIAGDVQLYVSDAIFNVPQVNAGKVRALAVTSRVVQLPNTQSFDEQGMKNIPGFSYGLYAAGATPMPIVERVNGELRALISPEIKQQYAARGYTSLWQKPDEAKRRMLDELALVNQTIDSARIERQ